MTGGFGPLVTEDGGADDARWIGQPRIIGPSWSRLPAITIGLLGVQLSWSVEMSYASPYLLSLGLSKSWMAIVFIAGPLSGLIVQPLIGVVADYSKSSFGRRRPFIVCATLICSFALLLLGFTRHVAALFTSWRSHSNDVLTIWLAVFAIYCIDFSINAVQAVDRALLVDTLPTSDQPGGNAWAARMLAVGSVAGFYIGNIDLTRIFPILGDEELEVLTALAAILLLATQAITCFCTKERVLVSSPSKRKNFFAELKEIWETIFTLPQTIKSICVIQFCAWCGWFPYMFYTTTYIGELHKQAHPVPLSDEVAVAALNAEATRLGTRAMFYSALVSLAANAVLPMLIKERKTSGRYGSPPPRRSWLDRFKVHLASLWAFSHLLFAVCMAATLFTSSVAGATFIMSLVGFSWACTQWAPFALLAEAILAHPGADDAEDDDEAPSALQQHPHPHQHLDKDDVSGHDSDEDGDGDGDGNAEARRLMGAHERGRQDGPAGTGLMRNVSARESGFDLHEGGDVEDGVSRSRQGNNPQGLSAKAGVIIGIHNISLVIPQFLVTGLSSIIFALFDSGNDVHGHSTHHFVNGTDTDVGAGGGDDLARLAVRALTARQEGEETTATEGPNAVAIIFRLGGVAAAVGFVLAWRLARELKRTGS
ncbi:MFS general substrate transporter [Coniophora puteana RWD-64-598 SS2]|uniref:MFS general substrate transporter n=1 Tax=Coniophora puteana (strain RWD-64-598) TaxID=741705 RepID=R7SDX4_CONPW|nr:MFS general substrate transporter [Coniophora puteana RWD-64-598 SS2]EIW74070.1 MFS general substrate transporter [Coniophora puteana RWD-64-598 SS2]